MISKSHLKNIQMVVELFDSKFQVGPFKFGLDPLFGFFPILGDLIPLLVSVYMIFLAVLHRLPTQTITAMLFFTAIDFIFGTVPIAGDIIDFFYKSHTKNFQLLSEGLKGKRAYS